MENELLIVPKIIPKLYFSQVLAKKVHKECLKTRDYTEVDLPYIKSYMMGFMKLSLAEIQEDIYDHFKCNDLLVTDVFNSSTKELKYKEKAYVIYSKYNNMIYKKLLADYWTLAIESTVENEHKIFNFKYKKELLICLKDFLDSDLDDLIDVTLNSVETLKVTVLVPTDMSQDYLDNLFIDMTFITKMVNELRENFM